MKKKNWPENYVKKNLSIFSRACKMIKFSPQNFVFFATTQWWYVRGLKIFFFRSSIEVALLSSIQFFFWLNAIYEPNTFSIKKLYGGFGRRRRPNFLQKLRGAASRTPKISRLRATICYPYKKRKPRYFRINSLILRPQKPVNITNFFLEFFWKKFFLI